MVAIGILPVDSNGRVSHGTRLGPEMESDPYTIHALALHEGKRESFGRMVSEGHFGRVVFFTSSRNLLE